VNAATGTLLGKRYVLTEPIAAGGMGQVWQATDTVLDRTVAVKLLNPALSQQSGFLERFRAEARNSASLHHRNITMVFDYGEDEGSAYLVMELVAGQPLSRLIAEQGPLSAQTAASILIQAASALEAAHQAGVVHRDVKPANIMVTPDGTAKLTDFGISRLVNSAPLTQTGEVLGTAQYLSPEQVVGHSATASSDIYALGVVGHEMLTGQRPFEAETILATAMAHMNQPPPPLPDTVPAGIRNVISAALAKEPADRPATAAAMAQALRMPEAPIAPGTQVAAPRADRTQAMPAIPAMVLPAPTQVMATQTMAGAPRGIPDRRSRFRPAWLLGATAAGALLGLAALALPGNSDSTRTPAATPTTSQTSNQNATPSTSATVIAPPAEASLRPGQLNRARARARGHDNKKDGKQ
jgi:eukaryotic-like serine/threonine-protein kinase